jgi:hypothetical protein
MTTRLVRSAALGLALVAPAWLAAGCQQLECAEGTIEQDGRCVPADGSYDDGICGPGTQLGDGGQCEPVYPPTLCDPDTTTEVIDPEMPGVVVCQGEGGGARCDAPLSCPTPGPNRMSICGQLYDVETDQPFRAPGLTDSSSPTVCGDTLTAAGTGPCSFEVKFYDALQFANNPAATPLAINGEYYLDDCGRFRGTDIALPSLGFYGIGADDEYSPSESGQYRLSGVAFPDAPGTARAGQKLYVTRISTDQAWSTALGFGDNSVLDRGVFMTVFYYQGVPRPGVQVTDGGAVDSAADYYFSDVSLTQRSMPVAEPPTQMNGAALSFGSGLTERSGVGAEPAGCEWQSDLARAIPGVLFFSPRVPYDANEEECQ